ncbi:MAG TPA: 2Fe-2S iron-sulfur cluster-binding protein [Pyrinomonadaceae bacterium]|nr:2Fe-2S iron-sulfur cluster-binding protein [Pyrinomonadaceae bacterium]
MSDTNQTKLEEYLKTFSETEWLDTIAELLPSIHPVDQNAVQIWFRFHSLALFNYLESAENRDEAEKSVAMQGKFSLSGAIDSSHDFLYGHRYWKTVKAAIEAEAQVFASANISLGEEIRQVAAMAAEKVRAEQPLIVGITAVGLMTLLQVGFAEFNAAAGEVAKPRGLMSKSPKAIVAERAKDDSQGLLGFLKTINKKFSVIFDETSENRFDIINDQEVASASGNDRSQNWQAKDERCWEGPVPVECVSASCGTCWVGVLGGQEKLSDLSRRERRAIKVFGYDQSDEEKPFIRLACQAKAAGNVTIVIPPWNAVFGKKIYKNIEDLELEPVTTSAKALREAVREATAGSSGE